MKLSERPLDLNSLFIFELSAFLTKKDIVLSPIMKAFKTKYSYQL